VLIREHSGKQLVVAFFDNPAAGDVAARVLEKQAHADAAEGTVGVLALDSEGRIAAGRLGPRATFDGAGVGAVLGVIALAVTGRVLPRRGHLFDTGSDLSTDDVARFAAELEIGQAVVAVLDCGPAAERAVVALTGLGGKAEVHWLTDRALCQAAAAPVFAGP
jgi:hypothetical protein